MDFKLGKQEHSPSPKTVMMENFLPAHLQFQPRYDFDKSRAPFPLGVLANDVWGCCVKSGQANQIMRLERVEQRGTLKISDADVEREYKIESAREFGIGPTSPGDDYDQGLIMRRNNTNWRKFGFQFGKRSYNIAAFGEIDPNDLGLMRAAIYHFGGVQYGLALPLAARAMMADRVWDYQGQTTPDFKPGSWGGHCVFSKAYEPGIIEVLTWGTKVHVTDAFIQKYCDECWVVIDNLDSWRTQKAVIDIPALEAYLQSIGASHIERN